MHKKIYIALILTIIAIAFFFCMPSQTQIAPEEHANVAGIAPTAEEIVTPATITRLTEIEKRSKSGDVLYGTYGVKYQVGKPYARTLYSSEIQGLKDGTLTKEDIYATLETEAAEFYQQ